MRERLIQLAYDALALLIPALVALGVEYLRRRLGTEGMAKLQRQLGAKKELAILAVRFAEQAYKDLGGPAKYDQAAAWLSDMAGKYRLTVTDDEIKGLIEAALRTLKDEFTDQWTSTAANA